MADRLPSLPLFVDDYEAATVHLTVEEDGAYMRLLRLCWRTPRCSIPDDDEWIMRRMRVDRATFERLVQPIIDEFFKRARGRIFQKRLLQEFAYATDLQSKRKTAGKAGAAAKASKTKEKGSGKAADLLEQNGTNAQAPNPTQPNPLEQGSVGTGVPTDADASDGQNDVPDELADPPPEAPPKPTAVDFTKAVFDTGIAILKPVTRSEQQARGILGRWRQTYTDGPVITVLARCEVERPQDPISWITAALQAEQRKVHGNGSANRNGAASAHNSGRGHQPAAGFERRAVEARLRESAGAPDGRDDRASGADGELPLTAARALPGR